MEYTYTNDRILLISEDYVRQNSNMEFNLEFQFIIKSIYDAQKLYIEPLLGTELYDKITYLVDNDTISGATNYKTLLVNFIQPCLLNYTILQAIPLIHFKMNNKSINKLNSTNSETSDLESIKYLQDYYKNIAEMYSNRINRLLLNNTTLYPEYGQADGDDLSPSVDDYTCDIVFD